MSKHDNKWYINEVKLRGLQINPLESYINYDTPILCECKVCGNRWKISPDNLLRGKACPKCVKNRPRYNQKSHEEFINEISVKNSNVEILGKYIGANKKIKVRCCLCGLEYESTPTHLLSGRGCRECAKKKIGLAQRKSNASFVETIKMKHPDFELLTEYKGAKNNIKIRCLKCGMEWERKAATLLYYGSCPRCGKNYSLGEKMVGSWLDDKNIKYKLHHSFPDLKGVGGHSLTYDFYVEEYNLLIEYQGQFHEGTPKIQKPEQFLVQKKHDELKRKYAQNNNIKLLEIWYYDFNNINKILNNEFKAFLDPVTTTVA